jgi:tetratricopeptide (TPR) repeat protein
MRLFSALSLPACLLGFALATGTLRAEEEKVRTPAEDAEIQLNMANELYSRQMYSRAVAAYEEFLKSEASLLHPRRHEALFRLGECLFELRKFGDAVDWFDSVIRKHPESEFYNNALFRRGTLRFLLNDPDQAIPDLQRLLERLEAKPVPKAAPLLAATRYFLGLAYRAKSRLEAARPLLETVAKDKVSEYRKDALKYLADVDFTTKNWKLAIEDYESYRKECPPSEVPFVDYRLGQAYREVNQFDNAVAALRRIPAEHEYRDLATCIEIDAFFQKGAYADVVQSFAALDKAHPEGDEFRNREDFGAVLYMAGASHFKLSQHAECIASFGELARRFEKHPKLETAQYLVSMSYYYLRDPQGMERSASAFLEKFPRPEHEEYLSDITYIHGDALFGLKQFEKALSLLSKIPTDNDFHESACQRIPLCYLGLAEQTEKADEKAANRAKAAEAYDAYVTRYPESEFARKALLRSAEIRQELKRFDEAEQRFSKFLVAYKDDTNFLEHALFSRAQCQLAQKKFEAMATSFAELLRRCPETRHAGYARYWIGRHYENGKDWEQAVRFFLPVKEDKGHELSDDAIHRLALCYLRAGKTLEATETLLEIFRSHPKVVLPDEMSLWVASQLATQNRLKDAIWVYENLLKTKEKTKFRYDCKYMIHNHLYTLKEWENATQWGEQLLADLDKAPDKTALDKELKRISKGQVLFQTAFAYHQLDNQKKAESFYARVKKEGAPPELINETEFWLGKLYRQMGEYEKALSLLLSVGIFMPKYSAEAQYEAGLCLIQLAEQADVKKGIEHLENLIKLWEGDRGLLKDHTDFDKNPEVRKLLEEKRKLLEDYRKQVSKP